MRWGPLVMDAARRAGVGRRECRQDSRASTQIQQLERRRLAMRLGAFLLVLSAIALTGAGHGRPAAPARRAPEGPANPPFGIDKRVPWTTSRVVGSPKPPLPFRVRRV